MSHDYTMKHDDKTTLASLIGKKVESYLGIQDDGDSYEEFLLRAGNREIVLLAKEIETEVDWLQETCALSVTSRDAGSPDWNLLYPKKIGKELSGISRIVTTMEYTANGSDATETAIYDRGIILHFADNNLVIDRGVPPWSMFWSARWAKPNEVEFGPADPDPEYPEFRLSSMVVPL